MQVPGWTRQSRALPYDVHVNCGTLTRYRQQRFRSFLRQSVRLLLNSSAATTAGGGQSTTPTHPFTTRVLIRAQLLCGHDSNCSNSYHCFSHFVCCLFFFFCKQLWNESTRCCVDVCLYHSLLPSFLLQLLLGARFVLLSTSCKTRLFLLVPH